MASSVVATPQMHDLVLLIDGPRGQRDRYTHFVAVDETFEPEVPTNWPDGHVAVALTDDSYDECIEVTIHGVRHYLHSSTARALSDRLIARIDEWNFIATAAGFPPV